VKYLGCGLIILIFLIGCGGGSSKSTGGSGGCCPVPGINVEVVSPTGAAAIDGSANQTLAITVKVTNDSSNAGVTWTVGPAIKGGPSGTLSGQTALSVIFTPPTGITSPVQETVTATSVTDTTRSAAIPITIYPPLVAVTTSANLATAFLNTNYTCIQQPISIGVTQIPCAVRVTGGLGPYTWSLGNSSLPFGLQLAPGADQFSTEIIGTPTATGVSPFSLTATDATGNTATMSLNINVAPSQLKVGTPTLMALVPGVPYTPVQLQAAWWSSLHMESGDRQRCTAVMADSKSERSNLRKPAGEFFRQHQLCVAGNGQSNSGPGSGLLSRCPLTEPSSPSALGTTRPHIPARAPILLCKRTPLMRSCSPASTRLVR
jgi:hypothetical protein